MSFNTDISEDVQFLTAVLLKCVFCYHANGYMYYTCTWMWWNTHGESVCFKEYLLYTYTVYVHVLCLQHVHVHVACVGHVVAGSIYCIAYLCVHSNQTAGNIQPIEWNSHFQSVPDEFPPAVCVLPLFCGCLHLMSA